MSVLRIRCWIWTLSILALLHKQSVRVCEATLCSPPCLLVSNTSDIVAIDYQTGAVRRVTSGLTRAVAIDVHFNLGYIFWSDVTEQNIKRLQIGGSVTTIVTGIGVCDGLVVDWRSSELYWTDTTNDTISISDLNGSNQRTVINSGLEEPRAIALDLDSSLMFWTDWGTSKKIEKASLDGNQRVAIVTTFLYYPNGIELDRGNKQIFWVDAGYDIVESVDYNGNNRKHLFQLSGSHPFGVTLIAPFLFFTDWNTLKEVHNLDAMTGHVIRSYSINGGRPMGIVAFDYARQPPASSPCALNNGGCSHFCVAKQFGYECVCPSGLTVKQDGKTCEDRVRKFIMFTDADGVSTNYISLDVDYFISRTLFTHLGNQRPIALDYDPIEDRMYWSDVEHGRIFSAFFNATSLKTVFHCNVKTPDGLAIDHVGRNIYWTDTGTNRIEAGRLDGKGRKLLFKDGLDEPKAIVLDERNGMMYWTDWGDNPKIEQSQMDGSARQVIVRGNLGWPNGLTIDQATNRLFWADAKLDKIEVSDLDGGNRHHIISYASNIHPYGLAVYMNVLYWTDWNHKSIVRYNLSSGNTDIIVTGLQKPMDIHVFDPTLILSGPHNCSQNNGLCSDFCLLKPGGYQCACPTGIALKSDGKTCDYATYHKTSLEKFLIYAEAYLGRIDKVPLTVPGAPCFPLGITRNITRPVAVDYDPVEGKVYWTDVTLKLVARAFPNGSSVKVIAHNNIETPDGIAVDYVGRNIYWTDKGTSKIEVARLDGSSRRTLITSSVDHPRAILLDIAERKLYWSDWGSFPKIEKANMDGSARTTLVSSGLTWVNSLALDYKNKLLYWCDASLDRIERVDLQGNNRVLILDLSMSNLHPFGLALSDNAIYWSDWNDKSLHKHNMTTFVNEVMVRGIGTPMEVHIHDHSTVFSGTTSCSQLNGGCSHLCLPNPSGHQCFCPEGVQLKPGDAYTCQGVNRCLLLSAPANGSVQPCKNLPGETCLFSCDAGYSLTGSRTRTCDSYGSWTGTQPQCNVVTCPALPIPPNGNRQGCNGTITENYGTVCLFSCNTGFNALGSPSRKCLQNGTWSGQVFLCQVIRCPSLPIPNNGLRNNCTNVISEPFDTHCGFSCNTGYNLIGSKVRRCLEKGTWSGQRTNCRVVKCPAIKTSSHVLVSPSACKIPSGVPYHTDCIFKCNVTVGYLLKGVPKVSCLDNGSWSDDPTKTACKASRQPATDACPYLPPPRNGAIACDEWLNSVVSCTLFCAGGFDFANKPPKVYLCDGKGKWLPNNKVPDCSKMRQAKTVLASELYYLTDQCTKVMHTEIASNFIALYTKYLGTSGNCDRTGDCSVENVQVECGEHSGTLRKRDMSYTNWTSKAPLTLKFAVKVSLPSNTFDNNLNETNRKISSNILAALNEQNMNLNINGIVLKHDVSKPPVFRFVGLVCNTGQVLRETKCVNCPLGYFFGSTGCQACAVNKYQDKEAQTSCVSCPSGTSTFGQTGSKGSKDCQENAIASDQNGHAQKWRGVYQSVAIATGSLILTALIGITIFSVRKYLASEHSAHHGTCNHVEDHSIAVSLPEFDQSEAFELGCINQSFSGVISNQSETGNETNEDLFNSGEESPQLQLLTSSPKYVTRAEDTFSSAGGKLCAELDSDVSIIVDSGAIPVGIEQRIFFGVICNETTLVQDVPKAPAMTLISPVIECGPHGIELLKPVKIIVPHCLDLSKAKKEEVTVYRCERFHGDGNGLSWEKVPNEWEKSSQSKAWFTVKQESIHIRTKTFSLWSFFACGGPRKKRATVFASKPDPKSDLIYLRFYVYSDNEDSKRRVEFKDKERFPDSKPAREKPFKLYNDNKLIRVKLTDIEEGWVLDKTDDTQIFNYEGANRNGFRTKDACDFAVKPERGREVNGFSCIIKFQQEDHPQEYKIYLNPGFTPLKRQSIRRSSGARSRSLSEERRSSQAESCRNDVASRSPSAGVDGPFSASAEVESGGCDSYGQEGIALPDSQRGGTVEFSPLGKDDKPLTESHFRLISSRVGASWRNVLRELTLDDPTIEYLEEDYRTATERLYQGLLKWKGKVGCQNATAEKLCDALHRAGCSEALKALNALCVSWTKDAPNGSDC